MLTILNDTHLGAMRSGGTTPATAYQLRQVLLEGFEELVMNTTSGDLMILGDLFDTSFVPMLDLLETYRILRRWTAQNRQKLYLVAGNHDLSKSSSVLSSFQFLCRLMTDAAPEYVVPIFAPAMTDYGYVVPHLPNQDLFDAALALVPECDRLFLHCNFDNSFAQKSDQSLNLTKELARTLPVKNIIIAHEHQASTRLGGKVIIPGNQMASSVADCLGEGKSKQMVIIREGTILLQDLEPTSFMELDWKELKGSAQFIRVTGEAQAAEAADVVAAISRFRQQSDALVVTNAVAIHSEDQSAEFAASLEAAKSFDVLGALKEHLTVPEWAVVEKVLSL